MPKQKHFPVIGKQYGQWTVISDEIKRGTRRNTYFRVECNCGRESWRLAVALVKGTTNSCKSCAKTNNNIDTYILSYFNKISRRAIKSGFEIDVTANDLQELYFKQGKKCALSQLPLEFYPNYRKIEQTASLDRIDSSKGYVKGNIQWVHKNVNFMKGVLSQERFIELCEKVARNVDN